MRQSGIDNVTVIGAGNLGSQIAWHSAFKGKHVTIYDSSAASLETCKIRHSEYANIYTQECGAANDELDGTLRRLRFSTNLSVAVREADLVIEAVPEVLEIKREAFHALAPHLAAHTLLVTNSSALLPSDLAEATGRPDKFCALHFANLIWSLNLVELMAHPATAKETLKTVAAFAIEIGMVPLPLRKESPGYITNAWLPPLITAAISLVARGVATAADVDRSYLIVNRGCRLGPCGIADIAGIRTVYNVFDNQADASADPQARMSADFLKGMIDQGLLGVESGQGFYRYPDPAYADPAFLAVPSLQMADDIADTVFSGRDGAQLT